jgi:hypothetical protein
MKEWRAGEGREHFNKVMRSRNGPDWKDFSDADILAVRADPRPYIEIAKERNVHSTTILAIKHLKSHADIPGPPPVLRKWGGNNMIGARRMTAAEKQARHRAKKNLSGKAL